MIFCDKVLEIRGLESFRGRRYSNILLLDGECMEGKAKSFHSSLKPLCCMVVFGDGASR